MHGYIFISDVRHDYILDMVIAMVHFVGHQRNLLWRNTDQMLYMNKDVNLGSRVLWSFLPNNLIVRCTWIFTFTFTSTLRTLWRTEQILNCCFLSEDLGFNFRSLDNRSNQPDTPNHLRQNIMEVDAHSFVQEALQILKCRTEPSPIQQPEINKKHNIQQDDGKYVRIYR